MNPLNGGAVSTGLRDDPRRSISLARILTITEKAQLYGWDARLRFWHGPDEMDTAAGNGSRRLVDALRRSSGKSWYGPVQSAASGGAPARFFAVVQDLGDAAVGTLYCGESKTGPAEIVAVLPAARRSRLRPEFAFEFLAFASFVGSVAGETDMEIHNHLAAALAETPASDSLVFSIATGLLDGDADYLLSSAVEKIALARLHWRAS